MDDLTKIKGIGKATAKKLADAGFGTYAALAAATGEDSLAKLQDAGVFAPEVHAWASEAAELIDATQITDGDNNGFVAAPDNQPAQADAGGTPAGSEIPQGASAPEDGSAVPEQALPGRNGWLELEELGQEEAERRFPLVLAALKAWAEGVGSADAVTVGPTVRIAAKRDGFRRAGMAHPRQPTEYPAERFTPEQLEALLADAGLKVELA